MPCLNPGYGYYSKQLNPSGKRSLVFKPDDALNRFEKIPIPCRKCLLCRRRFSRDWAVRIYHESRLNKFNSFLTLTYSDDNIPQDGKINKRDIQLFLKNLRNYYGYSRIRYFVCGEYGDTTRRPHYHGVFFGEDFREGSHTGYSSSDNYFSSLVDDLWGKGHCVISPVTPGRCSYVAGYVLKKADNPDTFRMMSTKPSIGRGFLDKYLDDFANHGFAIVNGSKTALPSSYLKWYESAFKDVKATAIAKAKEIKFTQQQLESKAAYLKSKSKQKVEKI